LNAASEQLSSPPVLYSWLLHLFTWVQQPSHGLLSLQPELPRPIIVPQSRGGGGGIGGGGGGSGGGGGGGGDGGDGGARQWAGMLPLRLFDSRQLSPYRQRGNGGRKYALVPPVHGVVHEV
jgi:hypothetical protein